MKDFARFSVHRKVKHSPFAHLQHENKQRVAGRVFQKVFISALVIFLSVITSLACVTFGLLQFASWKRDRALGTVILTGPSDTVRKTVTVVWSDPQHKTIQLLSFPDSVYVRTPSSGMYSMSSLYGLFALERKEVTSYLRALARNIRIDVSGVTVVDTPPPEPSQVRSLMRRFVFDRTATSSLSFANRVALWWYAQFEAKEIIAVSLPEALRQSNENVLDDPTYDAFVAKKFVDASLQAQPATVALVNASNKAKLASTVGRLFTALGMNVVSLTDVGTQMSQNRIAVANSTVLKSQSLEIITRYIDGKPEVDAQTVAEYRADIVIFLGTPVLEDFTP